MAENNSTTADKSSAHLFFNLFESLENLHINEHGTIESLDDKVRLIIKAADAALRGLAMLVRPVSLVLHYAQDSNDEADSRLHWINYSLGYFMEDIGDLIAICEAALQTRRWPRTRAEAGSCRSTYFFGVPYLNAEFWSYRPSSGQLIPSKHLDTDMFNQFVNSISEIENLQSTNLRVFSESFRATYSSGEVGEAIDGALLFIEEWSGLLEKAAEIRDDAEFKLSELKQAA